MLVAALGMMAGIHFIRRAKSETIIKGNRRPATFLSQSARR